LDNLENQTVEFGDLKTKLSDLEKEYIKYSLILREKRKQSAKLLSEELMNELKPLKMEKVRFDVEFKELDIKQAGRSGMDAIRFVASTNVGTKLDELSKIASGGELSRFMLALKVVLLKINSVSTLIFDEIDTGVSGQVADAIGDRLKKLSEKLQVFVITHLPQVASKGNFHLKVKEVICFTEAFTITRIRRKTE
jgi:DNA repair protein RecN (Recombination protein N)